LCENRLRQRQAQADYHALFVLEALGWVASARGQARRATWLLGGVAAARERRGVSLPLEDHDEHEQALAAARPGYGPGLDAASAEAEAMTTAELVEFALAAGEVRTGSAPGARRDGLTGREAEVLRLIALGHSNREIAEELVLSVRTVERHITNIYAKIGARGKADATAYAFRHGLS